MKMYSGVAGLEDNDVHKNCVKALEKIVIIIDNNN